ncbi:MAG: hypothetical protein ABIH63_04220 [archaeon]
MKKSFCFVVGFLLFLFFAFANAFAFTAINPNADRISVAPGETKTVKVNFTVFSQTPQTVSFTPMHVAVDSNGMLLHSENLEEVLPSKPKRYSGLSFVQKINPVKTDAQGKWEEVPVTISVPKDAVPGDYPVAVITKPLNLASLLIIDVTGKNTPPQGQIKNPKVEVVQNRVTVTAEYVNTSSRTSLPVVGCSIKKDGQSLGAMELEISNAMYDFILPLNSRNFSGSFQRKMNVGNYEFEFFSLIDDKMVKHNTMKFNLTRDVFLQQETLFSIDVVNLSSIHLSLPSSTFFVGDLNIRNLTKQKIIVKFMPTDSWLRVEHPAVEIEPEKTIKTRFSIETPSLYKDTMRSKLLLIPDAGSVFEVSVKVSPSKLK